MGLGTGGDGGLVGRLILCIFSHREVLSHANTPFVRGNECLFLNMSA